MMVTPLIRLGRRVRAGRIQPDEVAEHDVGDGVRVHGHAALTVAGDDVARGGVGAADGVESAERDAEAGEAVAEIGAPGEVGADEIALDDVTGGVGIGGEDIHAALAVPGDDVARAGLACR